MTCGLLTWSGTGSSTVLAAGNIGMAGDIAPNQTLNVQHTVFPAQFTNAGTILIMMNVKMPTATKMTMTG